MDWDWGIPIRIPNHQLTGLVDEHDEPSLWLPRRKNEAGFQMTFGCGFFETFLVRA